ncbi:MAG: P1 family peptidase [Rubrivivax sp.]|nr:P1 family peptidase [Rubrivivax sp.]
MSERLPTRPATGQAADTAAISSALALDPGAITDVQGIAVGHAAAAGRPTGCTVVLCPAGAVAGVAVRGGAPGTRETDLLRPENTVQQVHAVLLTGGSAFGLDAAGGVMRWLEEQGYGLPVGPARVPIVPAAVLFDLWVGDARIRPDAVTGYAACIAAGPAPPAQGSHGAGLGATVGKLFGVARACRGGIGTASVRVGAITMGALVAVNAIGDVLDERGEVLAGARREDGERSQRAGSGSGPGFVGAQAALLRGELPMQALRAMGHGGDVAASGALAGTATTIGIVATDAVLDKAGATQIAALAHHGLSRAVQPVTANDGDTLFALATGGAGIAGDRTTLGAMAAEAVARAIRNAVRAAVALREPPLPAAQDMARR